jgi:serine/threonine protein kinase
MRLGPYELVRQIGAGGMGEVWAAHRAATGPREVLAVKRLPKQLARDPAYRRILLEEARLSALLRHPNIVHTIEAGEADGEVFIAMELIEGLDLSRVTKLLARQGERLPINVSAYVVAEILRGLAYAHELEHGGQRISLVHRDVSPHNVMLSRSGAIKLADFGVARLSSEDTSGTHVKGKARYMPPEQLRGDSRSPTVDLFAVGAVLQELLDGSTFRGDAVDDARLLGMAVDGEVPPPRHPDETPVELERLRVDLLEPDATRRVQSAKQALALLLRWPAYGPCPDEVAALLERLREHESELSTGVTQTGLANEATFLHTNELELDASQMAELARAVEAPDRILVAVPAEPPPTDPPDPPPRDPSLALDLSDASFIRPIPTDAHPTLPPRL